MIYFCVYSTKFVEMPVHNQLNPNVLRDMRNDEAYDVFDLEVRHECLSLSMAMIIFIV